MYNVIKIFFSCNSLRLWLPQLFKMMSDYEAAGTDGTLCDMISFGNQTIAQRPWSEDGTCEPVSHNRLLLKLLSPSSTKLRKYPILV